MPPNQEKSVPRNEAARKDASIITATPVERLIYLIRGQRVILDSDLAFLYGVATKRLNEQVRRNSDRFPPDFVFQLTWEEAASLRSQIATLEPSKGTQIPPDKDLTHISIRSQIATLPEQTPNISTASPPEIFTHLRFRPYAFTEHGVIMAASVLNSPQAVQVSLFVVRAFVKLREMLATHRELAARIDELERKMVTKFREHDGKISELFNIIRDLVAVKDAPPKPPIGFQTELATPRNSVYKSNGHAKSRKHK
jgi:hypothetical protein